VAVVMAILLTLEDATVISMVHGIADAHGDL
jgi:hypothetical protein